MNKPCAQRLLVCCGHGTFGARSSGRMAPRDGPAHRNWLHLSTNKLLSVAEVVLRQAEYGAEPSLSATDLAAAQRAIKELCKTGDVPIVLSNEMGPVWRTRGRSGAALMALLALSLRRASPFAVGEGHPAIYDDIRHSLSGQLTCAVNECRNWGPLCADVLGPALLRADALQCYAHIVATAAEQLQPAAAARLPMPTGSTPAAAPGLDRTHAAAAVAGAQPADHHNQRQQQQQPARRQGRQVRTPPLPPLEQLCSFLRGPFSVLIAVAMAYEHINATPAGDGSCSSSSSSCGSSPAASNAYIDLLQGARAQVQSSWVLEHWARVLLLGAAPALANTSDGKQQAKAHTTQVDLLNGLCEICKCLNLDLSDFTRRPWGCTLAATHIALTCAALDGGHACGWPRLAALVLPACVEVEDDFLLRTSRAARERDAEAMEADRLVILRPGLYVLRGWISLLAEALQEPPAVEGQGAAGGGAGGLEGAGRGSGNAEGREPAGEMPAADGHGTAAAVWALGVAAEAPAGVVVGQGTARGGGGGGGVGAGHGEVEDQAALPNQCRTGPVGQGSGEAAPGLPPLNRPATVALCLRLAKGVLARWGGDYFGFQVREVHGVHSASSVHSMLPKVSGCSLLYHALACARLALLPDVWGRERVPRRTRAQLWEWWETYVAAAQHQEALAVAVQDPPTFPDWTYDAGRSYCHYTASIHLRFGDAHVSRTSLD